jgi:hypothetical protein
LDDYKFSLRAHYLTQQKDSTFNHALCVLFLFTYLLRARPMAIARATNNGRSFCPEPKTIARATNTG